MLDEDVMNGSLTQWELLADCSGIIIHNDLCIYMAQNRRTNKQTNTHILFHISTMCMDRGVNSQVFTPWRRSRAAGSGERCSCCTVTCLALFFCHSRGNDRKIEDIPAHGDLSAFATSSLILTGIVCGCTSVVCTWKMIWSGVHPLMWIQHIHALYV